MDTMLAKALTTQTHDSVIVDYLQPRGGLVIDYGDTQ